MTSKTPDTAIDVATPNQWPMIPLGKLGRWGSGGTPKRGTPGYYDGDIPWLKISDLNDGEVFESEERITALALQNSSAKLLEPGALLIAMYGSIGKLGVNKIPCATNQAIAFCYPNQQVSLKYLFWAMKTLRPQLTAEGKGGTQQNISQGVLKDFEVPVPPRDLQDEIVSFIEVALATLEVPANRIARIPSLLKKFRQSVLAAACSGQLTSDWRESNNTIEQSGVELVQALERSHNEAGGHRRGNAAAPSEEAHDLTKAELPKTWGLTDFRNAVDPARPITYGILKPGPEINDGVPYIRVADFPGDKLRLTNIKKTSRAIEAQYARARLNAGDVLLSIRGTVGRVCVVPDSLQDGNITQDTARLSLQRMLNREYVVRFLQSYPVQRRMEAAQKGVAVRGINIGDVRALQIAVPPIAEQTEIVRRVESLFALADSIESRLAEATAQVERTTQAILAKAFRGDLC